MLRFRYRLRYWLCLWLGLCLRLLLGHRLPHRLRHRHRLRLGCDDRVVHVRGRVESGELGHSEVLVHLLFAGSVLGRVHRVHQTERVLVVLLALVDVVLRRVQIDRLLHPGVNRGSLLWLLLGLATGKVKGKWGFLLQRVMIDMGDHADGRGLGRQIARGLGWFLGSRRSLLRLGLLLRYGQRRWLNSERMRELDAELLKFVLLVLHLPEGGSMRRSRVLLNMRAFVREVTTMFISRVLLSEVTVSIAGMGGFSFTCDPVKIGLNWVH